MNSAEQVRQIAADLDAAGADPQLAIWAMIETPRALMALADIAKWQVCVLLATGVTPYVPATHTTAAPDKLVIAQVAVTSGQQAPYYVSGSFNHAVLGWPASLETLARRKEAFLGSLISINHLI